MSTQNQKTDLARTVLEQMAEAGIATMSREARSEYLSAMMMMGYQLLRTVEDDGFVRGFLESALAALDEPAEFAIARPN